MSDVMHPQHYNTGAIEVIDVIELLQLDFCTGNVLKYMTRAKHKHGNPIPDLHKAQWYLDRYTAQQKVEWGLALTDEEKRLFRELPKRTF